MGRPPLGDKARRIRTVRMGPETEEILMDHAKETGTNLGRAIDDAAQALKRSKARQRNK